MKKNKNRLLIFILLLTTILLVYFYFSKKTSDRVAVQLPLLNQGEGSYFYLKADIEGMEIPLLVDTGSNMGISLQTGVLDNIENLKEIGTRQYTDIKGNRYSSPKYLIDYIEIGDLELRDVVAHVKDPYFILHGSRIYDTDQAKKAAQLEITNKVGAIGTKILRAHDYWCLDFANNKMYCLRDFNDSVRELDFDTSEFIEVNFENVNSLISISIETDYGTHAFILDTGSCVSIIQPNLIPDLYRKKAVKSYDFIIGSSNLGPQILKIYDIPPELCCDGVLGVDFLKTRALLINFKDKKIYIGPSKKELKNH